MKRLFTVLSLFFLLTFCNKESHPNEILDLEIIRDHNIITQNNLNYPMNDFYTSKIILSTILKNNIILELTNNYGSFHFDNGINEISVIYFRRNMEFDRLLMYDHNYDPNFFYSLDQGINNNILFFPHWNFHDNIRKNELNGIIFIDSFRFCAHEDTNQQLTRSIFFSTNNFNITIRIGIAEEKTLKEIFNYVINETPEYFSIDLETSSPNFIIRWKDGDSIVNFGSDLINGIHNSETAIDWYLKTEEILNSLYIE